MENIGKETSEKVSDKEGTQACQNLLSQVDSERSAGQSLTASQPMEGIKPDGYSFLPPFLLENIAKSTGDQRFKAAADEANNLQSNGDLFRPNVDAAAGASREVYDAQTKQSLPGAKARFEGEATTGNSEVDNAYDFTGLMRDFYSKEFGRDSIDGKGMKYVSTVNYGKNYENAFWNGSQMTYGKPGENSPFKQFVLLDVAGHEITHGVTEKESGMRYFGQSGALNESMSDVFGELIDQYSKGQTADQADWLVGGGIWKDNVNGRALRDMLNPGTAYDDPKVGKDPQPAHMTNYKKTWGDNGGVHYNSGIPNRAFANFAIAVGGNAWDDPGHIWYAAHKAAGSNPSFGSFAYHTIEAAKETGKADVVEKLEKAWALVGVTPDKNAKDTTTPVAQTAAELELKKAS